jgi:hypothetical protein
VSDLIKIEEVLITLASILKGTNGEIAEFAEGSHYPGITTATYIKNPSSDWIAQEVERLNRQGKSGYFLGGILPSKPTTYGQAQTRFTKDVDICSKSYFVIDIDGKDCLTDWSALSVSLRNDLLESEIRRTLPLISSVGLYPWLVLLSGNGLHVHFKLSTPLKIESGAFVPLYNSLLDLFELYSPQLKADRKCSNAGRLFRLPFTRNLKGNGFQTSAIFFEPNAVIDEALALLQSSQDSICRERTPNDFKEEVAKVKQLLSLPGILSWYKYEKWDGWKESAERIVCRSPFSEDKTPSFHFSKGKSIYYCFSTRESGDLLSLIARFEGLDPHADFPRLIALSKKMAGIAESRSPSTRKAKYEDYVKNLFQEHLGETRRDLISQRFFFRKKSWEKWELVSQHICLLQSIAADSDGVFSRQLVTTHLDRYLLEHAPRLLIDIPAWDGIDRLLEISKCLKSEMPQTFIYEFFKDWGANMFRRAYNCEKQNRVLILQGPQGIGKDHLINALVDGLGSLVANLTITHNQVDSLLSLAERMILRVSEFDTLTRMAPGVVKDWVTRTTVSVRRPYAREAIDLPARASFIGGTNRLDFLHDSTGNRRYIIIPIKNIEWNYPSSREDQLQIIAQFHEMSRLEETVSVAAESYLKELLLELTPECSQELILKDYEELVSRLPCEGLGFSQNEVNAILTQVARDNGVSRNQVIRVLKMHGYYKRTEQRRLYLPKPISSRVRNGSLTESTVKI